MALNLYDDTLQQTADQSGPGPPAPENPYDETLRLQDTSRDTSIRRSLIQGRTVTPDRAAETRRLSQELGVPAPVIERNFDRFKTQAQADDVARVGRESPHLGNWIAADPSNAAVAQDDLKPLSAIERTLQIGRNIAGEFGAGVMGLGQGIWGSIQLGAEAIDAATRAAPTPTVPGQLASGNIDLFAQPKVRNADGSISTVDSFSINVDGKEVLLPTVTPDGRHLSQADAIKEYENTGRHLGTFATPEAADAYAQRLHEDYAAGKYETPSTTAQIAAFARGSAAIAGQLAERSGAAAQPDMSLLERGVYSGARSLGFGLPGTVIGAAVTPLAGPAAGTAALLGMMGVATGGQSYAQAREQGVGVGRASLFGAIQGAVEVGTEFIPAHRLLGDIAKRTPLIQTIAHQILPELATENVATVLQDLNEWATLPANKERTFSDYLRERPSQAALTTISVLTMVGAHAAVGYGTARVFEKLGQSAQESKTLQRSPEAAQAFIEQATKDSPVSHVYAPIDTFTSYWQSQGVDPATIAADLTGSPDAYRTAVATGQDLVIPTAQYAVKLAGTEHNAFFTNELRLQPDQMNAREAQAFEQQVLEQAQAPVEPSPAAAVRTDVLAQLEAAGVPRATAESYATLYESAFGTLGERAGVDPSALYGRYGLSVERPGLTPAAPVAAMALTPEQQRIRDLETQLGARETELRAATRAAESDALTGLANRAALDKALPTAEKDAGTAVIAFDANNFGKVNKELGHTAGDAMLQEMASAIKQAATEANYGERVFRRGGDEFVVLAPTQVAQQIRQRAEALFGSRQAGTAEVSLTGNIGNTFAEADATLQAEKSARKRAPNWAASGLHMIDTATSAVQTEGAPDAATIHPPGEGPKLPDRAGEQPAPDQGRVGEGPRPGDVAEPGRVPATAENLRGLPELDEVFERQPVEDIHARLTPEVTRELARVLDELETFPFVERNWHWLGPGPKTGNAAGGDADVTAGMAGATVYHDILAYSPVNKFRGQAAKKARGTRGDVINAIRAVLKNRDVHNNLAEGALRVAEHRNAADYTYLSGPELPPTWGTVVPEDVTNRMLEELDAVEPEGPVDTSFNPEEFKQLQRGAVRFGPDRQVTIDLLTKADLSTFLHESGHFFLEVVRDLAARPEGSDQIKSDLATLQGWFEKDTGTREIGTDQHEQFARGFEAYLMEGKAPSVELRSVFARFRAWLLGVYRSLRGLNVTLTPEVRGVFDRMLATDAAIAEAQQQGQQTPLFLTAETAGMTPAQFEQYRGQIADASRTARETLERQVMAEVRRTQTETWKAQRAAIEETVTGDVHQQPVYQALAAMQKGTHPDGTSLVEGAEPEPMKLSRAAIVEQYGEDRLKTLPRPYVYQREGGLHPDAAAELLGFSSGDELLTAISQAPKMRDVIQQETDRRMLAAHGSLLLDGTLPEKAQAATANDARDDVIRAELTALGKIRRGGPARIRAALPPADRVRSFARDRIAATRVSEIRPQVFWSASRRAAAQAIDLAARQDIDGAIVAKQQELVNVALYREAMRVKDDIETRAQQARDLGTGAARKRLGLAGESYLDQVDGILDRYEFARVSQKALDRRASLRKWVAALEGEGLPVDLPEELLDETRRVNYRELTYETLVGVTDGLQQIAHLARLKNRLLKSAGDREFTAVRDGVVDSIREHNVPQTLPLEFRPGDDKWRKVAAWFASHAKISMLARVLDGHQDGGAMWEAFIRPINAAADAEITRKNETGKAYSAILEQHYPGRELATLNDKQFIPAIAGSLSKEGRLAVALNWGNQTSRDRLLSDPSRRWSQPQVQAVLDTLDERDWRFVQDTWNFLDTFWPEIAAKQQRVTGVAPEKVEAIPVHTPFGELRGGYYPLAYDPRLNARARAFEPATEAKLVTSAAYVRTTTRRGHVEARQQNVHLSVRLELGVAFQHLDQVIHDLTHHETLIDTTRLLRDRQIAEGLYTSKALAAKGDLLYQQFTSALQDIALGSTAGPNKPTVLDTTATFLRTRTQIAGMAWNLWTALQQPLGLFNGASRVGPQWVARGMKRWLRDAASMENTATWIADVSPMMRERVTTATQDLHDVRQALRQPGGWFDQVVRTVSGDKLTQQTILDGYLWHIGLAQRVADIPTWLGQYEKSMAAGEVEARAIALADQAVLDSQGGGQVKDLAQIQRGSPIAKLFMTFYSYGNTVYNAVGERGAATSLKSPAQVLTFLGHLSLLAIMPAVATEALRCASGHGKCQDWPQYLQNVGGQLLGDTMNMMVLLREAGGATKLALGLDPGSRGYEGPAALRPFQLVNQLAQQIHQGQADEAFFKALNQVAGLAMKYPAAQAQRTVDGWLALEEGRTKNPAVLVFGGPPKKVSGQ